MPAALAAPPPAHGVLSTGEHFDEVFQSLRAYTPFTPMQNISGAPGVSVPLGRSSDGLPIGVQRAGPRHSEPMLLGLAETLMEGRPADPAPHAPLAKHERR